MQCKAQLLNMLKALHSSISSSLGSNFSIAKEHLLCHRYTG